MRKTAIYSQKTNYIKSEKSKYKFQKYIKKLYKKGNNREVKSLCLYILNLYRAINQLYFNKTLNKTQNK